MRYTPKTCAYCGRTYMGQANSKYCNYCRKGIPYWQRKLSDPGMCPRCGADITDQAVEEGEPLPNLCERCRRIPLSPKIFVCRGCGQPFEALSGKSKQELCRECVEACERSAKQRMGEDPA